MATSVDVCLSLPNPAAPLGVAHRQGLAMASHWVAQHCWRPLALSIDPALLIEGPHFKLVAAIHSSDTLM